MLRWGYQATPIVIPAEIMYKNFTLAIAISGCKVRLASRKNRY